MSTSKPRRHYRRPPRERARELITFGLALVFAFVVGRAVVRLLHQPPALIQLLVFVVIYAAAYAGLWRLGAQYMDGR